MVEGSQQLRVQGQASEADAWVTPDGTSPSSPPVSSGMKAQTETGREQPEYRGSDSFFQVFLGRKRVGGRGSGKAAEEVTFELGVGASLLKISHQ